MSLQLFNTMGRTKQLFEPADPNRVTMYVCGPTVYNYAHIGNARPVVVFDTLFRLLQTHYDEVVYARNITDIDDKILAAIRESGEDMGDFTQRYTQQYEQDMAALNALEPTLRPRATDNIAAMIVFIEVLIEKGNAYEADGHVLFAVESMADYGALSNRSLDDMLAGARVEVADYKRYPGDFVLWKPSSDEEPGWESPFGRGRPGWHLECSAMIREHLGDSIDIHGGGQDLIFPHHENEIAQSVCAHGGEYVRYWMHNAFLDMNGEKMSKSIGNVATVNDLLQSYRGEVLRYALISAHYRSPLDFTDELLSSAESALNRLYGALRDAEAIDVDMDVKLTGETFYEALNDDLNTPQAIAAVHELAGLLNKAKPGDKALLKGRLLAAGDLLGILWQDPEEWLQGGATEEGMKAEEVEALIEARQEAKLARDYARADEIRAQLTAAGIRLEDSRDGTRWRRLRSH